MWVRSWAALVVLPSFLFVGACSDSSNPTGPVNEVSIETQSLAEAIQGLGYSQQLEASGGSGGYTWVLSAGSLPLGLTLNPAGVISGTASAPGTAGFRVQATDGKGQADAADLSISVVQTLAVHSWSLADAVLGEAYSAQLISVGGRGTHAWRILSGAAAPWLTLSSTGSLSGTPTASGPSTVTVAVADESGQEASRELPLMVLDPLIVAAMDLPTGTQGRAYAAQLVASGGDGAYAWSIAGGALPMGMELLGGGALVGIPADGGSYSFTAQVTDGAGRVAVRSLLLTVSPAPTIRTTGLPPAQVGTPYATQLEATGGTGVLSWSVLSGALPPGLALSTLGALAGTPTALGTFTFTVQVMDEGSATHSLAYTLVVAEIETLAIDVPLTGLAGTTGSARYFGIVVPAGATQLTVSITGGTGDVDLYVRQGALPGLYTYNCRPLRQGNEETCTFTSPSAGAWFIMLRAYSDYSGVTLLASLGG